MRGPRDEVAHASHPCGRSSIPSAEKLRGGSPACDDVAVRLFDKKFGADFLAGVPAAPGVYRFHDGAGGLLYVGKAGSLRRRLAQYRTAGRKKTERKRRALVKAATTLTWEVCESELAAALTEIRLIQTLRPRRNVASAFPFLYPFIGILVDGRETFLCLTTRPEAFPAFQLHGAYRSREVTGEAFHALARLLRFVGHPISRARCREIGGAPRSVLLGFRRLPRETPSGLAELFRGARARRSRRSRSSCWITPERWPAARRSRKIWPPSRSSSTPRPARCPGPERRRATRPTRYPSGSATCSSPRPAGRYAPRLDGSAGPGCVTALRLHTPPSFLQRSSSDMEERATDVTSFRMTRSRPGYVIRP